MNNIVKHRIRKGLMILSGLFLVGLLALHFLLNYHLDRVIGRTARTLVDYRSGGIYRLTYGKIKINLLRSRLQIHHLQIKADTTRYRQRKNHNLVKSGLFEAKIPQVEIEGINFWEVFLHKKLQIKNLYVQTPHVHILDYPNERKREERLKVNNLYRFISDYLTFFRVENLTIDNGSFTAALPKDLSRQLCKIDSISLIISNFKVDSTHQPQYSTKPFEVADIELAIQRNSLQIPESEHEISMGKLYLSTKKMLASISHIQLKSKDWELVMPLFRLSGIDFHTLYYTKKLIINNLWLQKPHFRLHKEWHLTSHQEKDQAQLSNVLSKSYSLISKFLTSLEISHILLEKINLAPFPSKVALPKNLSILLHRFYLDSLTENQRAKHFFIDDITAKISDYELLLSDNLHFAKVKNLEISTKKSLLEAENVSITTLEEIQNVVSPQQDVLHLNIPKLSLKAKNLWENLLTASLKFEELWIKTPHIQVFKKLASEANEESSPKPLPFSVQKIHIENADIAYYQWEKTEKQPILSKIIYSPNFSAKLHGLQIDKEKYFDYLLVNGQNLNVYLSDNQHNFQIGNLDFSSAKQQLRMSNLRFFPKNLTNKALAMDANLSELLLEQFDIHQVYRERILKAQKLTLQNPSLKVIQELEEIITSTKQGKSPLKSIELEEVYMENGRINIHKKSNDLFQNMHSSEKLSAQLKQVILNFDSYVKPKSVKRLETNIGLNWSLGEGKIDIEDYSFTFPDNSHTIKVKKINLDYTQSSASLRGIYIIPKNLKQGKESVYQAEVPFIHLKIKDISHIFEDKNWVVEQLSVHKPLIDVYLTPPVASPSRQSEKTKDLQFADLFSKTPFNKLSINNFEIDSCFAKLIYRQANEKTHVIKLDNLGLYLSHFEIDSAKHHWEQLFDLKYINLSVANYYHILPDNTHHITTKDIKLFSQDSLLIVNELSITPQSSLIPYSLEKQDKQNQIDVKIPQLYLKGWDLVSFLEKRELSLSKASLEMPQLNLQIHRPDTTKKLRDFTQKLRADSLHYFISPFLNTLKINDFKINNANLVLMTHHFDRTNRFTLDRISVYAKKFDIHPIKPILIDESKQVLPPPFVFDPTPYHFLNSENLIVSLKNYTFQLPDKIHTLKAKSIYLSIKDSLLEADNVDFIPSLDKITFSQQQAYKKAWLYPQISKLTLQKFDFYSLLHHEELKMKKLELDKVKFEIYRDRGLPDRPDYYPPMPQDLLRELPFYVKIDSVKVKNADFIYEEQLPEKPRPGRLTFEKTEISLSPLTNHKDSLQSYYFQPILSAHTQVMRQGKLSLQARFFLSDPKNLHFLKGEIGEMDMTAFNEMLEYVFPVRITSGVIKHGSFDLKLNYKNARGRMLLRYNNLKVEVINRKFASFVANSFVVNNHNPSRRFAPLRVGEIKSRRNLSRSIFSYWGYSVLNGFKTSIGLRGKKQQKKSKFEKNNFLKHKKLKMRNQKIQENAL
ncbi:hypothetical protein [Thermoflexibacter ruber]|uniref:Uncharacterized protein n=1 Tax=Thermoflexibacter ruber TaxID=1003 RepID=A0A1I2EVG7_9BACT|nr:hypothetical protein [Thermoflexibacter ruber]SFE96845.1 hypothetical protein SAMN04488541_101166 [Thermoflexibacter ruber]